MVKIINKKWIDAGSDANNIAFRAMYAGRKYVLCNIHPVYYGRVGIAIAHPKHPIKFLIEEIRLIVKYLINGRKPLTD